MHKRILPKLSAELATTASYWHATARPFLHSIFWGMLWARSIRKQLEWGARNKERKKTTRIKEHARERGKSIHQFQTIINQEDEELVAFFISSWNWSTFFLMIFLLFFIFLCFFCCCRQCHPDGRCRDEPYRGKRETSSEVSTSASFEASTALVLACVSVLFALVALFIAAFAIIGRRRGSIELSKLTGNPKMTYGSVDQAWKTNDEGGNKKKYWNDLLIFPFPNWFMMMICWCSLTHSQIRFKILLWMMIYLL